MLKECTAEEGFASYETGKPGDTYFSDLDRTVVICGNSPKPHNLDAARRMNYLVKQIPVHGGCVVFQPHDFLIVHLSEGADDFFDKWSQYFLAFLREKGLDASCCNGPFGLHHDIIVCDRGINYKVGTHSQGPIGLDRPYLCAVALSFHIKESHIKRISTLSALKPPRGLSTFNVTIDEIKALFLRFMNETYNEKISC